MANDGVNAAPTGLLSDEEVGEKFGCAAGPDAACGNFLACARLKEAIAGGFNKQSGAAAEDAPKADVFAALNHDGKMG